MYLMKMCRRFVLVVPLAIKSKAYGFKVSGAHVVQNKRRVREADRAAANELASVKAIAQVPVSSINSTSERAQIREYFGMTLIWN